MEAVLLGPVLGVLLLFGNLGGDLVTLMNADDYFRARGIEPSVPKLMELAGKDPVDGKTQIQQLLALRVLGENPKKFKDHFKDEAAEQLKILAEIATGKKAQDKLGFAQEYAQWTHKQLGGKLDIEPTVTVRLHIRDDALAFFPKSTTGAAALDLLTAGKGEGFGQSKELRALSNMVTKMPAGDKDQMYKAIDQMGNFRISRIAVGWRYDDKNLKDAAVFIRISGKANNSLASVLASMFRGSAKTVTETVNGDRIATVITDSPVRLAVVGQSDLLIAVYPSSSPGKKGEGAKEDDRPDLIKLMLSIRKGKEANAHEGSLAGELKTISQKASGFLIADLPQSLRNELTRKPEEGRPSMSPFKAVPRSVTVEIFGQGNSLDVSLRGKMDNADEAKSFSADVVKHRDTGLEALKKLNKKDLERAPFPLPIAEMKKSLEGLEMKAKGDMVHGKINVPASLVPLPFLWLIADVPAASSEPDAPKSSTEPRKAPASEDKAPPKKSGGNTSMRWKAETETIAYAVIGRHIHG